MKKVYSLLVVSFIVLILAGCNENYKWNTDNTSVLEGKYEVRDKSLDLNKSQQTTIAKNIALRFLYANSHTAGISVSMIDEDGNTTSFAYGCAKLSASVLESGIIDYTSDSKENCEIVLLPTHRMKLGSLTKTTVARTVLDIDNDSSYDFSLDDPITKHLPDNILALGSFSGITVSQLLHHDGGLNEIDFTSGTVEEIITKALAKGKLFNPGQMYQYNNLGYILLGQIIQHVTPSEYWETEVQKRINESIGSNSLIFPEAQNANWIQTTNTEWLKDVNGTLISGEALLASGYDFYNTFVDITAYNAGDIANSAGNLMGSVPDITRWMKTVSTNDSALLTNEYFTNHVWEINTDTYVDSYMTHLNWNMGPGIGFNQDQNALFHLGLFPGYTCSSVYSKNEKITLTACINGVGTVNELPYEMLEGIYPYRTPFLPDATTASH